MVGLEHIKLFPTHVFGKRDVLSAPDHQGISDDIMGAYDPQQPRWQSSHALWQRKEYKSLVTVVKDCTSQVLGELGYSYEDGREYKFQITGMWANILKPGLMHMPHTHPNNFFSGVYYVRSDGSEIIFFDPKVQAHMMLPQRKKDADAKGTGATATLPSLTNGLYIFPAWLLHWVPPNQSGDIRISISWNIQLKGEMGSRDLFQYARY